MPDFAANFLSYREWNENGGNPGIGLMDAPDFTLAWDEASMVFGALTDTQPVDELPDEHTGEINLQYAFLHWYNRIHIEYTRFNLGNVVGDQELSFWIFNAFFIPQTLAGVAETGVSGIELIQPGVPPYDFAPFEEKTYDLLVSTTGAPEINALYEFDFPGYRTLSLEITGIRVIGWHWEPNWAQPISEKLTWVTDVIESYNGKGQFIQLREYPRRQWDFLVDVDARRARTIENSLYGWNGRVWAVPVFTDIEMLVNTLPEGSESAPVTTATKSYMSGGMAMIISADGNFYETAEIESVDSGAINFVRPLAREWGPGSKIYPVDFCRMPGQVLSRFTDQDNYGMVTFESVFGVPYSTLSEVVYRGYPVLEYQPEWNTDPTIGFQDKIKLFENPIGQSVYERESSVPRTFYTWNWQALDRGEIDIIRKFLYSRKGRARAVWISTGAEDLVLKGTMGAASNTMDVEHANLVKFITPTSPARKDLRIELVDGTVFYRRVTQIDPVDENTENISIDAPLGEIVEPQDIRRISWLALVRMSTDEVSFNWEHPNIASVALAFRGSNNDV